MSKKIKASIVDATTLKLEEAAAPGDLIDLNALNKVDTSGIVQAIEAGRDEVYLAKLAAEEKAFLVRERLAVTEAAEAARKASAAEIAKLKDELTTLKATQTGQEQLLKAKLAREFAEERNELREKITTLEHKLAQVELSAKKDYEAALSAETKKYAAALIAAQQENTDLRLEKSSLSVKLIGEKLETWCNNEYEQFAIGGFDNCTWEKDNETIKYPGETRGTKADYIFTVYAGPEKDPNAVLTKVVLDMKSEDPTSKEKSKKKNADHYAKLHLDREKKHAEYAILVSELEWSPVNDVPIWKVGQYDKMYGVRPQYFMVLLSLIKALSERYAAIITDNALERQKFATSQEIIERFNALKENLLDKPLADLAKEIEAINKQVATITGAAEKIAKSTVAITKKVLDKMQKNIEKFDITDLADRCEQLNN